MSEKCNSMPPEVPHHEVLKRVGGGSYGDVWLARNIMGVHRAIKVVRRSTFESDKPYNREFEGLGNFEPVSRTHDGFMNILQVGRNDAEGYFFYVMEAADDESSGQNIEPATYHPKTLQTKGRLPLQNCLKIALSLADSLHHLHRHGLVHRDIKLSNIIFVNDLPKLADIGLVTTTTNAATFIGAPGYIPPEGPGTPQGDVYALGKVLYEIVTGNDRLQFPQPPMDLEECDLADFQELNEIILKACESDPRRRYSSAEKMHEDLVLLQGGKSVRRMRRMERTFKLVGYSAVVIALVSLGGCAIQKVRMTAAQKQAKERQRELLTQQLVMTRLTAHSSGWSKEAWAQAREAAKISTKGGGDEVRNQAAALLAGLDARQTKWFTNFEASSVRFDREGNQLLMGGLVSGPQLYERRTDLLQSSPRLGTGPVAFTPNGVPVELHYDAESRALVLLHAVNGERIHDWKTPSEIGGLQVTEGTPQFMELSHDSLTVIAVFVLSNKQEASLIFQAETNYSLGTFSTPLSAITISPQGELAAVAESSGRIAVWSVRDGQFIASLPTDRNEVLCLSFKKMNRIIESQEQQTNDVWLLAGGDSGGNVTIWDLRSQVVKAHCRGGHHQVLATAFSPDGATLASGGRGPSQTMGCGYGSITPRHSSGRLRNRFGFCTRRSTTGGPRVQHSRAAAPG